MKAKDIKKGKCGTLKNGTCACRDRKGKLKFAKQGRCKL